jgi:hypothetical protein
VAIGGGLHVGAYYLEDESVLSAEATVLCVALPVAVYVLGLYALYTYLASSIDRFHVLLIALSAVLIAVPVLMAAGGVALAWCLIVLALTPWVTVVGYELRGHEHNARVLQSLQ